MIFNIWTFLFEVVNFLALVYVLRRLLYRPLRDAIDQRKEANAKAHADAEKARLEANALEAQLNAKLAGIDQERQELIKKAREQNEADRKSTMAAAESAVNKRREEAARQLEGERAEALRSLQAGLVETAVALAERFLRESCDSTLQQQLVSRLVDELQQFPDDDRERLRGELEAGDSAVVEAAGALNGEVLERISGELQSLLGRPVGVSVQLRPELLGGVRLRLGGHLWDATLTSGLREAETSASGSARP